MEMGLRLVVIATVALIASTILVFMFTSQSGSFGNFIKGQSNQSECKLLIERGQTQEALEQGCTQEELKDECFGLSSKQKCKEYAVCTLDTSDCNEEGEDGGGEAGDIAGDIESGVEGGDSGECWECTG